MAAYSGQITLDGSSQSLAALITTKASRFRLACHPDNSNPVYIGNNDSDAVSSSTGYILDPAGVLEVVVHTTLMKDLYVLGSNNEKLVWMVAP